jgi:beta-lactamase regulating signal transducer with metallopeptidase domain
MPGSETLYGWLVDSALAGLAVLAFGTGAVLLCRQPARRLRIIELSLAGCLIAPWLGMIPGYPQLAIGWRHAALPERHDVGVPPSAEQTVLPAVPRSEAVPCPVSDVPSWPIAETVETPVPTWDVGSWLVALYLFGVAMGIAWGLLGVAALVRIIRTAHPAPPQCRQLLVEIAGRRSARVQLLASRRAKQPFALAWWPTTIVLPDDLCDDEQAVRWALAHEWTHIERHDFRAWFIAGLARLLFFYQPLVWWLRRQLRLCQDFVADARASRQAAQPEDYAEFLTVRAAAGLRHPAVVGLGMGFSKSELYRRVIMLVQNRPLESRPPRLWTVSVTCAAWALVAVAAALSSTPRAAAEGESAAASGAKSAAVEPIAPSATRPFTAKFPTGVEVELLGISVHPLEHDSWWRPDGSPLAEPPCDPQKVSVRSSPHHVLRQLAVQFHHRPAEPMGTGVLFDPPCGFYAGYSPDRVHKTGLAVMTVGLPDQPTVTVRVRVAAGPWETVCETARGACTVGRFAFSPVYENNGRVVITVTHNIVDPQSRVVAVGVDGREHRTDSWTINRADGFVQLTEEFSGLSPADIKAFRVQTRPYQQVEFRNVSIQPGQKTNVQIIQPAAPPVTGKAERPAK